MNSMRRELLKGFLEVMALKIIADHDGIHGYGIIQRLEKLTKIKIDAGTVYPLLWRLSDMGLIYGRWMRAGRTRKQRIYRLKTTAINSLDEMVSQAQSVIDGFKKVMRGGK